MNVGYFLFMSEAEGWDAVNSSRLTKINAAVKDFIEAIRSGYNISDDRVQDSILSNYGINELSTKEKEYIKTEVEKHFR